MGNSNATSEVTEKSEGEFTYTLHDDHLEDELMYRTGSSLDKKPENIYRILRKREHNIDRSCGFNSRNRVHAAHRFIPNSGSAEAFACMLGRIFCGQYSKDGTVFMAASQDRSITFFDTTSAPDWKQMKRVAADDMGWSIIDTDFSPDQRWLIYGGWSDYVSLCNVYGEHETKESLEIHTSNSRFCLFSMKFSPDSNEILCGSSDYHLYVYDLARKETICRIQAHLDEINTVAYGQSDNNLILSGGDDCLCKAWDRRLLPSFGSPQPTGVFVGHTQGITHISPKGDGRYFISNGKDQCVKLWDIRKMNSSADASNKYAKASDDYRYGLHSHELHPNDVSVMTYTGHTVSHTLIRSYFSPIHTTGQKYIYTGSSDGIAYIYDVLSGKIVGQLKGHRGLVRDLAWHPYEPTIVTTSWDKRLGRFTYGKNNRETIF